MFQRLRVLLSFVSVVLVTSLIACGGNPNEVAAKKTEAASGTPVLTISIAGAGTGTVEVRDANTPAPGPALFVCTRSSATAPTVNCPFDTSATSAVPPVIVTAAPGTGSAFVGFKRPYCEVNDCGPLFDEYPDFIPPSPYWVAAPYEIALTDTVAARFGPAPTFKLTVYVTGPGTGSIAVKQNETPVSPDPGSPPRGFAAYIFAGAKVDIAGSGANVVFQVPYCVAHAELCASMLALDPEWYPPTPNAWAAGLTFNMMGAKSVIAYIQ